MQVSAEAAVASFHILTSPDMPKAGTRTPPSTRAQISLTGKFRLPNYLETVLISCIFLVYLEDVIERTVLFIKFHLRNGVYPAYDPVYADPKGKGILTRS